MTKSPLLYIKHISDAIDAIQAQTQDVTKEQFENSELLQGFVERKLEIIGEATKRLPEDFKMEYPNIPWKDMAGMRDILIHQYAEVDGDIVWKTITQKLSPLKDCLKPILIELTK
jgi:uncharacterized protein with HEPN domain